MAKYTLSIHTIRETIRISTTSVSSRYGLLNYQYSSGGACGPAENAVRIVRLNATSQAQCPSPPVLLIALPHSFRASRLALFCELKGKHLAAGKPDKKVG